MRHIARQVGLLVAKDLRIEARARQTLGLVVMLGILIVVVLGLGLDSDATVKGPSATAILWVAYLFGGVLCFEKTMAVERHDGAMAGLLLAPIDRGVIYLGKLIANLILMLVVVLVVTPVGVMLMGFDLSAAPLQFALILAISMIGFAAVGTLFAAAVSSTRLQGGLLAMVSFPIALPLVITTTRMMLDLFADNPKPMSELGLTILIAFDVIYLTISWIVFELALEP